MIAASVREALAGAVVLAGAGLEDVGAARDAVAGPVQVDGDSAADVAAVVLAGFFGPLQVTGEGVVVVNEPSVVGGGADPGPHWNNIVIENELHGPTMARVLGPLYVRTSNRRPR